MTTESLGDIFFSNLDKFGENCAVIFADGKTVKKATYNQLAAESCKVSQSLRELCADSFIGLFVEQDLSLLALILGILDSNLPFMCIDVQDSQERILHIFRYLCVKWVFTKSNCSYVQNAFAYHGTKVKTLCLHNNIYELWKINVDFTPENKFLSVGPTFKLAYAIQTSGSTGKPKIILVPHQCILPNVLDIRELLHIHHNDIIFLASPLTFDPSIVDMFLPLTSGASLLIVPSSVRASPSTLLEILFPINKESYSGASILQITPSSFSRWSVHDIQTRILSKGTTLKKLLFGGESCPNVQILHNWKGKDNTTEIYNIYGITEVSCWASVEGINLVPNLNLFDQPNISRESVLDVPLGTALSKTLLRVCNDQGEQIFCGEGELYIGSSERICLVNEETLQELSPPVFRATGDIVKWDKTCNRIMFVGRKNRIIKRWGHRVCLNGVEKVMNQHPNVEICCCVWDRIKNILAVAVVWTKIEEKQSLRLYCVKHLHKAEVPDKIVTVKLLPLTRHGKINYEKLQSIVLHNDDQREADEKTSLSSQVLCVWRNIIGREPLPSEKFMSSGGNSILAIQVSSELEKIFGESIRNKVITMLLNNSSILEIENYLLRHGCKDKTQSTYGLNSESISTLSNVKKSSHSNEEYPDVDKSHEKFTGENFHSGVDSTRKRKLLSGFPQTSKQEKVETPKETITSKERWSQSLIKNQDTLIKVSCRGTIIQKETLCDTWMFKSNNNVCLQLNWKFNMHKCVDASPCYLKFKKKSLVVVGSHSHLLVVLQCLSGKEVSRCELPDRIESSVCPSACGQYGIVGCYDGCVYCISLERGDIVWSFRTGDMVKSTPTLCLGNTAVVVGSYDSNLYCIDLEVGNRIWNISPSTAGIYTSPCVSNSIVYIATLDGTCVALCEKTGQQLWKTQVSSPVFSSPVLAHSSRGVIFTEVVGIVHCFSAANGRKIWQFKANGQVFSTISTVFYSYEHYELLVFGSHDKNVYCLKWEDGVDNISLNWKQELDSAVFATPFIYQIEDCSNALSNISTSRMTVTYVMAAASKGLLYILNAEDGSIKCSETLPHEIFSSPTVCDSQLIVGCRDNYLYCYSLFNND